MSKKIIKKPVKDIIEKIDNSEKSNVFLAGVIESGKSVVLDEYKKTHPLATDVTFSFDELMNIYDEQVYELYHVCLIVKKILDKIRAYPKGEHLGEVISYNLKIKNLLYSIDRMYFVGNYSKKESLIKAEYLNNPKVLFDGLVDILISMGLSDIVLIVDDFDFPSKSNSIYQRYIYETLANKLKFIATVSDQRFINNKERRESFKADNELIDVNYSFEKDFIIKLFDTEFLKDLEVDTKDKLRYRLSVILNDKVIEELIRITNGNIFNINCYLYYLYQHIPNLDPNNYAAFLLNYANCIEEKEKHWARTREFHLN